MSQSSSFGLTWVALWLVFSVVQSSGQTFWNRTNGPYLGTVEVLFVHPAGAVFAGSYRSTNQGDEWIDPAPFPVSCFALNSQGVLFAGGGTSIHRTTDSGVSWEDAGVFDNTVLSVAVEPQGSLLAGTGDIAPHGETSGGLYRSTNEGSSWSRITIPDTSAYSIIAHPGGVLLAATLRGRLLRSSDGGLSWLPTSLSEIFHVTSDNDGKLYACSDCCVYTSEDTGRTWSQIYHTWAGVNQVVIDRWGRIFVSMYRGGIAYSTDNGSTWNATTMTSARVYSIALDSTGRIYCGLSGSGVYRSTDNGVTWVQRVHGFSNLWTISIAVSPSGTMYAGTYYLGLWSTTNNGDVWAGTALGSSVVHSLAVQSNGYVYAGTEGALYRSTNDGASWTTVSLGVASTYVLSLSVGPSGNVFAGTSDNLYNIGNVSRSTDNGATWTTSLSGVQPVWSLAAGDSLHVYAGTWPTQALESARIYGSTDGGQTWSVVYSAPLNHYVASLATSPGGTVFAGIAHVWDPNGGYGVVRSWDYGATWSQAINGLTRLNVISLAVNTLGRVFAGTLWGGAFSSANKGTDWTPISSGLTEPRVWALAIDSSGFAYAGTQGEGGVYRSLQPTILSVPQTDRVIPGRFALETNYPNPFNPSTTISYSLPHSENVTLKVYDMLGREVAALVDGRKEAGNHSVSWQADNFASGVYFYQLRSGGFVQVRKLLLLR